MTNQQFISNKPKTLIRQQNDVLVSWDNFPNSHKINNNNNYILQIYNDLKEWRTIYSGYKNEFKIKNLAPCTYYNLRLKLSGENNDWVEFKTATDDGSYIVRHMTRAINSGIMSLIRKIAHSKPHLLETENKHGLTPLIQCIEKGDLQLATFLITLGANVNTAILHTKRTPIMFALNGCQLQIATLLISKGCDIHSTDINGMNILHHAIDSNDLEIVKFALKLCSPFINCKDGSGWTPLLRAVILHCKEEIIEILLANGAHKSIIDCNGFDFDMHHKLNRNL